jgi:squalene-associated FAD-dependent desaturase
VDRLAHLDQGVNTVAKLRVAVIGGGWAGLAAAVELSASGAGVTLFEAARQLGGRARRVEHDGHILDNGQHILIGAYRETLRLMHKVGADSGTLLKRLPLELSHPAAGFHMRLPQLPAPWHLAIGLLHTTGSSLAEKFSAVRFMRSLQASNYRLSADCSVAEWLDRHQQHGRLRRFLWEPLCLSALNTSPENASAQIYANVLRESLGGCRADTDLLLPAADLGAVFPDAASCFITAHSGEIRLSTRVDAITPALGIAQDQFDHIILATAPQHAVALLASLDATADIAKQLESYSYEPIGTVYAGYPPELRLPCPMLGLESTNEHRLGQWAFDHGSLRAKPGLIAFVLSASGNWDTRSNTSLLATLHRELEQALGTALPQPLWHQVIRERRATFSCRPNLPRPAAQTPHPGVWLAGDYACADYPATLEGAVRSGVAAAHGILKLGN